MAKIKVKVKMLTGIAGNANPVYDLSGHSFERDEIVELHPKLAKAWIQSGIAEAVQTESKKPVATRLLQMLGIKVG